MTIAERRKLGGTKNKFSRSAAAHFRSHTWYTENRKYHIAWMTKYQKTHRQDLYPARRSRTLQKRYGITSRDFDVMLETQNGVCAICGSLSADNHTGKLFVDHCHDTGRIRGLLCLNCNRGVASLTVAQLKRAISYMEGNKEA